MGLNVCKELLCGVSKEENSDDEDERHLYGRSPDPDPFLRKHSYVYRKVCKNYLKCDIKPWKKLKKNEKISLEYLPTDFFDRDRPGGLGHSKMYFKLEGETYRRVIGFRELMMKREYASYLEDLKRRNKGVSGGGVKGYPIWPMYQYWRLARGGGPKKILTGGGGATAAGAGATAKKPAAAGTAKKPGDAGAAAAKKPGEAAVAKKAGATGDKKPGEDAKKPATPAKAKAKPKAGQKKGGCFSWLLGGHKPSAKEKREKAKKNKEQILKHQAVKKWKWPNIRKRLPAPKSDPPGKYVVLLHHLYRMPKETEERDNEWLYLSSSTEDENPAVVDHFDKEMHKWMTPGISYESQKLFRAIALLWSLMNISGRSFLHHRNNYYRGHIEYSCKKRQMIPFFLTTILLWTILCMSVISYCDINTRLNILEVDSPFIKVEKIELLKYWFPYAVFIGNLILVTFWSLSIILGDGPMVAHYLNCWCAALHEMETSGALGIRKITLKNLQLFIIIVAVYTLMFIFDWPGLVRGSCMLTSMLLLRPSIQFVRINHPGKVLLYQWIGFGIQVYVLFCARMVMCTLQVFAQMVTNVSEMWNFKFSLRFHMLAKESRGELFQLTLNHSINKLWSHHRLICSLLEQYGLVFSVGIMCYIIPQVCIFVVALASLILNDEEYLREFYGNETHIKVYSDNAPTIEIPYYHSRLEENILAACIFLHIAVDFFFTTETLVAATDAFMTGAAFVRRAGMMSCEKSHERRLIYSLQWSFSPTRLQAITANRFFVLDRPSLLKLFSFIILIFTIVIRTHTPTPPFTVTFPPRGSCEGTLGQELVAGICTVSREPVILPIPPPPPADYYFFMEHCVEIESKHSQTLPGVKFEYYSETSPSGVVLTADQPPFQICRVKIPDDEKLPTELEQYGRYFQDHGSPKLQETLKIYFSQTIDVTQINYLSITGSTTKQHSDSTGGGYCGPDASGQVGKLCEWVEYYRDCVVVCYSPKLGKHFLLPRMFKKTGVSSYELYNDYSKLDCGLNPFGFKFKGDKYSTEELAYDCYGNQVKLEEFDECSNIPWKEPKHPFTPVIGDSKTLQRSYTSDWLGPLKSFKADDTGTRKPCDKCYDYQVATERCSDGGLVQDHCPYSRYWGVAAAAKGYYQMEQCLQLHMEPRMANGFCQWDYVEGGVLAGHVISEQQYIDAKPIVWDKEWDLTAGDLPPCKQPGLELGTLRPIVENLYYKHACVSTAGPCDLSPAFFYGYRPYELNYKDCGKLRQIKIDYDLPQGNAEICNFKAMAMYAPENVKFDFNVQGTLRTHYTFHGCHGGLLLPTNTAPTYTCISPEVSGICEVDAVAGFFFFDDCHYDKDVISSSSKLLGSRTEIYGWTLDYGLCSALIDYADPVFKNERRKLLTADLIHNIIKGPRKKDWTNPDMWAWKMSISFPHPGVPALPDGRPYCDKLERHFCSTDAVALYYPTFPFYNSTTDRYLCNWEAYIRDCLQPFWSDIYKGWVYLPKSASRVNNSMLPNQRRSDPLLNVFLHNFELGCDRRYYPTVDKNTSIHARSLIDDYYLDQCGWLTQPDFVDMDRKGIAIMAPLLPFARKAYSDDGQAIVDKVLHCFETDYAIYRCLHPEIQPICQTNLTHWMHTHGVIDYCYRFNSSCFKDLNKEPTGSNVPPTHPEGFCRGYCAMGDVLANWTMKKGALNEDHMSVWRQIEAHNFHWPPCKNPTNYTDIKMFVFGKEEQIREIEDRLYFQFHCGDPTKEGLLRGDEVGGISSSFHWPMYWDEVGYVYRYIPVKPLKDHLTTKFGPNCAYGGVLNEKDIYPPFVDVADAAGKPRRVNRDEFLGCHGESLILFSEEFLQNTAEMNNIGVIDPLKDYHIVCAGRLLAGWCEAVIEPLIFMRDDFQHDCKKHGMNCTIQCSKLQGHFSTHPIASQVVDVPDYEPFVKSTKKYVKPWSDSEYQKWYKRTDIPYRKVFTSEFRRATEYWKLYDDYRTHSKHRQIYHGMQLIPKRYRCYHPFALADFYKYCTFPLWLHYCVRPCRLVWPQKYVTRLHESLIEPLPGLPRMYMGSTVYKRRFDGSQTPLYTFTDCVIDPHAIKQNYRNVTPPDKYHLFFCNGKKLDPTVQTNFGALGWSPFPDYLPDFASQQLDPTTGFTWVPWKAGFPKREVIQFTIPNLLYDPNVMYKPNYPNYTFLTWQSFASPYLQCHRLTQPNMALAAINAKHTWQVDWLEYQYLNFTGRNSRECDYRYDPDNIEPNTCTETPVWAYVEATGCMLIKFKSRMLRNYGFCKMIMPAIAVHQSLGFLAYRAPLPAGCITATSNFTVFNDTWREKLRDAGYFGFGIKYTMEDVYDIWNSLCHSCAYTREMHRENIRKVWCGYTRDSNQDCQARLESHTRVDGGKPLNAPVVLGEGIVYKHWEKDIRSFGMIWKMATTYACWNGTWWNRYARWRTYHPWSQKHEHKGQAAYLIHVPTNALGCPYPCNSPDESEDCNSKCPIDLHSPCSKNKTNPQDWYIHPDGLNYTLILKEKGAFCRVPHLKLNANIQGLGIFGEYGTNIVTSTKNHHMRENERIYTASSETVMLDDKRGLNSAGVANFHGIRYTQIIWGATLPKVGYERQDVIDEYTWQVPRAIVVHTYHDTRSYGKFSTYCAALPGDLCKVVRIGWDSKPPPSGYATYPQYLLANPQISPLTHLDITYSSECTAADEILVEEILGSVSQGYYSDLTSNGYCCIPFNKDFRAGTITPAVWSTKFLTTISGTWVDHCKDEKNPSGNSRTNWLWTWDNNARYLSACPFDECRNNMCRYKLRGVKPQGDTDYCTRQFDPTESFLSKPLSDCTLPLDNF